MPEPITDDDLRELLSAATPGPWSTREGDLTEIYTHFWQVGTPDRWDEYPVYVAAEEPNVRLIALAPSLAAEVLSLRSSLDATQSQLDDERRGNEVLAAQIVDMMPRLAMAESVVDAARAFREKHELFHPDHWVAAKPNKYCNECDFCAALSAYSQLTPPETP